LGNTYFSHDFSTAGINGTETMVVQTNQVMYEYVFDQSFNFTALASTGQTTGSINTPEYTNPIKITMLGKPFLIVGIGSNQVKMLSGSVGTADPTTPVVFQGYSVYSPQGSNGSWAKVVIKDQSGNTVDTLIINQGDSKDSTATGLTIKVTNARALQDGTVVGTDLVVGPIGSVEKTYSTSCDITSTGTSDTKFPGETQWCIQVKSGSFALSNANTGYVSNGDTLQVVYRPQSTQYFKMASTPVTLPLPNNYGEIGFEGWNYNTFATLTFAPVSGVTGYYEIGGGTTNSTSAVSNLNGVSISSDVPGTIVDPNINTGFNKAYVLFNTTNGTCGTVGACYGVLIGFWDSVNGRIGVYPTNTTYTNYLNQSAGATHAGSFAFNFTLSYAGGAAAADQQTLYVNLTYGDARTQAVGGSAPSYFHDFRIDQAGKQGVLINEVNTTSTWSSSSPPQFRLYQSDSAEAKDVQVLSTPAGGPSAANGQQVDIGTSTQNVVTDTGLIVLNQQSYGGSNQAVVQLPAQSLKVKAYVGHLGGVTTTTGLQNVAMPITSAVAKLDTEVGNPSTVNADIITVGGSCVNSITAQALNLTFPSCGDASGIPQNAALIEVMDNTFSAGHQVLIVEGWEATNTRTATSVLQQYGTLLSGLSASAIKVTSATAAGITPM